MDRVELNAECSPDEILPGIPRSEESKQRRERLTQMQRESRKHYLGDNTAIWLSVPAASQFNSYLSVLTNELGFRLRLEGRFNQTNSRNEAPFAVLQHRLQYFVIHAEQVRKAKTTRVNYTVEYALCILLSYSFRLQRYSTQLNR